MTVNMIFFFENKKELYSFKQMKVRKSLKSSLNQKLSQKKLQGCTLCRPPPDRIGLRGNF